MGLSTGTRIAPIRRLTLITGSRYIGHAIGPWFVNGNVSFGWNDYSENRNISFPGLNRTATGGYSGQDYAAFATTGYHFYTQGLTITPLASLQYTHVNLGSYSEGGAGDTDLKVNAQSYDFVESGLGVVARPFAYQSVTYVPEAFHFMWFHELSNPLLQNTAAFNVHGCPGVRHNTRVPAGRTTCSTSARASRFFHARAK